MQSALTAANLITVLRILLIPVFLLVLLLNIAWGNFLAAAVFVVAAATDGLDGYVARANRQVTPLGQLLDPIADKLLVAAALLALVAMGRLPTWVVVIILGREVAVTALRMVVVSAGRVIPARGWGKAKTISQIVAIVAFILPVSRTLAWALMALALALTVWSGLLYFFGARDEIDGSGGVALASGPSGEAERS